MQKIILGKADNFMIIKLTKAHVLLLLFVFQLFGCSPSIQKHDDPFYNDVGAWDSARIPLINPYYIVYIDKEHGWQLPLKGNMPSQYYYYNFRDISGVIQIAIQDNIIMAYTTYAEDVDKSVGQKILHWFVIVPEKNIETGFDDEQAFFDYIQQLGIQNPNWAEPEKTYQQFFKTGCIDWIPDCK
jgi:hypothetical protein